MSTRSDAAPEPAGAASYYGLAEIAAALGLDRQLVTSWRRRRSHEMPEPDAELASGPIWRGETIEPWIASFRQRLAAPGGPADLSTDAALRVARRLLRCAALLLETPVRAHLLGRAMADLSAVLPEVDAAEGAVAERARAALEPVRPHLRGRGGSALRAAVLSALPDVRSLVESTPDDR